MTSMSCSLPLPESYALLLVLAAKPTTALLCLQPVLPDLHTAVYLQVAFLWRVHPDEWACWQERAG